MLWRPEYEFLTSDQGVAVPCLWVHLAALDHSISAFTFAKTAVKVSWEQWPID